MVNMCDAQDSNRICGSGALDLINSFFTWFYSFISFSPISYLILVPSSLRFAFVHWMYNDVMWQKNHFSNNNNSQCVKNEQIKRVSPKSECSHTFFERKLSFCRSISFHSLHRIFHSFHLLFFEVRPAYTGFCCVMLDILNAEWCYPILSIFFPILFCSDDAVVVGVYCWHNCGTDLIRFKHSIPGFWLEIHFYNLREPSSFARTQIHRHRKRKLAYQKSEWEHTYSIRLMYEWKLHDFIVVQSEINTRTRIILIHV